jgi:hypothetical protein
VEAGLLELFFDVDATILDEGKQVAAQPGDLGEREPTFGDVDGLTGEVGRGGVAFGGGGVAVSALEPELELDGADGGVDLQGGVEAVVVIAAEVGEELCGPGAAEAPVIGEAVVDAKRIVGGDGHEHAFGAHAVEVGVVLHAAEAVLVGEGVLPDEDLVGAEERSGDDETASVVVKGWEDDGTGGGILNAGQLRPVGGGADDADHGGLVAGHVGAECIAAGCGSQVKSMVAAVGAQDLRMTGAG